ncbi:MAG: adenylyltransferase/cytidyltransferase family protein [Limnothrix sp. RL_2_0]|nr:adenylyltransferase/cytidyltransferase family protein [Limnothrix sp. RL_2_0]
MGQVYDLVSLQQAIAANPKQWRPLVFTNGCFDLLHVGHVRYLSAAKTFGKTLVVGVNGDRSVREIKPQPNHLPSRPIIPETQRAEILMALGVVDAVVIFNETTATRTIEILQPEFYVKGGDYTPETLPEAAAVSAYGGQIRLIKIQDPTSTSGLITKILQRQ